LLDLLADLEAGLDFVDEGIQFVSSVQIVERLRAAASAVDKLSDQIGSRSASQPERVVLAGWPNVGKSTLFNALVGRDAAIVSPQAGTTRDYMQSQLKTGSGECVLVDTAGIGSRCAPEEINATAWRLAEQQRSAGDVVLLCLDSSRPINEWEQERLAGREADIVVWTKCESPRRGRVVPCAAVETSAITGHGLNELRSAIANRLSDRENREGAVASTAARCKESIVLTRKGVEEAIRLAETDAGEEIIAAEIRAALVELGKVVGAVYTDDLLDRIFSRFCIGK